MAKTKRYGKRKSHHKKKSAKRTRSKRGSGRMTRLQAGGQPVFVGAPWNGANTNTWGVTNHYAYNPQGSGSGDPLDIVLGTRSTKPGSMIGGKRRYRKKRRTTKKHHKKSSKRKHKRRAKRAKRGGALIDDMNGPGNWVQNQIDRSIAGGSRRRKGKKHVRKSKKSKRKHMKGGYAGDMPFQNTVNFFRGISNNLGNVVHGFRGYPEVAGPSPVDQPGMEPPRMPVPMPADVETLYKNAQTHVGSIGTV